ncbi:phytoene dehydrogenase-like protein [Actinomadura coerulea]|uniref:Pyridine nucleotide-disulfide oxidoreductase domain-containing protein 2 n=1 Tax=Actinomadura coerulea TaxID=46159 RepID=A0A7X0FY65_9ACTN|nr:NAD(P)/FAD-dependent oxidoreductase [Actinomadura coerulea]MBB6395714.1 phytoene dehydrogenase-like protein [Actinomadura coerulea]GGQ26599.1 FAD-dependent oxidoreductase [Actinomadura coerulea]
MSDATDAIVIGSGVNGLVAAAELAGSGWSVTLVEANSRLGGFIATDERTLPGYLHDTFSAWHPLFVSGPGYARLGEELHRHGLTYRNTDGPLTASVADDGRVVVADRDPEATAAGFADAEDRRRYLASLGRLADNADQIGALMGSEITATALLRNAGTMVRRLGRAGAEAWARDLATSGRAWCRREFNGPEVDHLWAPWLLHAGLSPDHASGGFMIPVLAATMHGSGLPVVEGGAGRFVAAFESLLRARGVEILTGTTVERIAVEGGRATGVVAGGRTLRAARAIVASVTPTALYGRLLPPGSVSDTVLRQARGFRYGRGEMHIHVALSAPPSWRDERLARVPLLHVSDGSASTGIACAQAEAGLLPDRPTVVVGRQDVLDPSRVPEGAAALWLQLQETPFAPVGDAAGELDAAGAWTPELARGYAARVLDRVERHAPGLQEKVLAIDVITPADLAAGNPNAEFGDPYGGSAELDQNFFWRPLPGARRHSTPVRGLWHIGASTHPGAGLNGASGHLVAEALTAPRPAGARVRAAARLGRRRTAR